MKVYNNHNTVTAFEYINDEESNRAFYSAGAVGTDIVHAIFDLVEYTRPDLLTPLGLGKDWLFELTFEHQPRTGRLLMTGSALFLVQHMLSWGGFLLTLGLEVQGKVVLLYRGFHGSNPSDDGLDSRLSKPRSDRLPDPLRLAYYHRFMGMSVPGEPNPGLSTYLLPTPHISPVDSLYDKFYTRQRKKMMGWLKENRPDLFDPTNSIGYADLYILLSTRPFHSSHVYSQKFKEIYKDHIPPEPKPVYPIDTLVFSYEEPGRNIYHFEDWHIDRMRRVVDPVDVVDRYCEHILLNRTERFDFLSHTEAV
jgi:hypothetical protein